MKKLTFAMMGGVALTLAACSSNTEEAAEEAMENGVAANEIIDEAIEESNEVIEEVVEEAAAPPPAIAEDDLAVEDHGTEDVAGM